MKPRSHIVRKIIGMFREEANINLRTPSSGQPGKRNAIIPAYLHDFLHVDLFCV